MHTFYSGKIKDVDVVAVFSGCGKDKGMTMVMHLKFVGIWEMTVI